MKALTRTAIICLSMLLQGCSLAINAEDIEPTDLSALAVGTSREEFEKVLGAPTTQEPEAAETIAIYAYIKGAPGEPVSTAQGYLECWGLLNIFCEPIMTPIAMVNRQERYESQQGQVGIHYGVGGTVMLAVIAAYDMEASFWETLGHAVCGNTDAQYRVGDAFESGRGVHMNPTEAFRWYSIAAPGGNPLAARVRDLLAPNLARDGIDEAEKLVADWDPDLDACEDNTASAS